MHRVSRDRGRTDHRGIDADIATGGVRPPPRRRVRTRSPRIRSPPRAAACPCDDRQVDIVAFIVGVACLALVAWDVFEGIVVPRPTPGRFRIARHITRLSWRIWRRLATRPADPHTRDRLLGLFAPALVVALLLCWLLVLIVGYGLVFWALRSELHPVPGSLADTLFLAGADVLTLGSADVLAGGGAARLVTLVAAGSGLGVVALVITFLFSLFGSFQRREILVVRLQARAGAPPSAVALLETYARLRITDQLAAFFAEWESWSAEVLDSHIAYPTLAYFRSSHDDISWISALGAVLDTAALVLTTIRDVPRAQAELTKRVGAHFVEDISNFFGLVLDGSGVERSEFEEVHERLSAAGYDVEPVDVAWTAFERARATYATRLEALAEYWAVPAAAWIAGHERPKFRH